METTNVEALQQESSGMLGHPFAETCAVVAGVLVLAMAYAFRAEILGFFLETLVPRFAQHMAL